ncbi:MAG TPA: hypothetical protein VM489_15510, partial [Burkholderiales bacterium]|nr:hypothetical protein [Burkholderiales bacterium]
RLRLRERRLLGVHHPHDGSARGRGEHRDLPRPQAAPVIERFLAGRKRMELAAAELRRLRAAARIEYVGDFRSSK